MLMVFLGKAGTRSLENFFSEQMEMIRRERTRVTKQVNARSLALERIQKYYSSWIYSAIHVWLVVPGGHNEQSVAARFGVTPETAHEAIDFLIQAELVERTPSGLRATERRIHLGDDSTMIRNHHTNWRLKAISSLTSRDSLDLHYSGPIAVSRQNAQKIRELILRAIKDIEPLLATPDEEEAYGISLDFFLL